MATPFASAGSPNASPVIQPSAEDRETAEAAVEELTRALDDGDFNLAWSLLNRGAALTPPAGWSEERAAFFTSVAGDYQVVVEPTDIAPITDWLEDPRLEGISLEHAVLVEVKYPKVAAYNQFSVYVVIVSPNGATIFDVR